MEPEVPKALVLIGPTASGKTDLSLWLAETFSGEIVNVDSMQVYRKMDIGTAKPSLKERRGVPHHLIDIVEPDEEYNLARFVDDALEACKDIAARGKLAILAGGTGLYLKGLLYGLFELDAVDGRIKRDLLDELSQRGLPLMYEELQASDPLSASRIHPNDRHRIIRGLEIYRGTGIPWSEHLQKQANRSFPVPFIQIGLQRSRDELYARINSRVGQMVQEGLLDEVKSLLAQGYDGSLKSMQSIGYRHMVQYLANELNWDDCLSIMARDTRRYAKRQFTWFNRDSSITWIHPDNRQSLQDLVGDFLVS